MLSDFEWATLAVRTTRPSPDVVGCGDLWRYANALQGLNTRGALFGLSGRQIARVFRRDLNLARDPHRGLGILHALDAEDAFGIEVWCSTGPDHHGERRTVRLRHLPSGDWLHGIPVTDVPGAPEL